MSQLKVRRLPPVTRVSANGHATTVVIVENHQLGSESLSLLLDGQKDMEVVGSATSVAEAAALPRQLAPDVVVMDFHLDDGTGRDAAIAMRHSFPDARFVFFSRDDSDGARLAAVEAGAIDYLQKSRPASVCIAEVRQSERWSTLVTTGMVS